MSSSEPSLAFSTGDMPQLTRTITDTGSTVTGAHADPPPSTKFSPCSTPTPTSMMNPVSTRDLPAPCAQPHLPSYPTHLRPNSAPSPRRHPPTPLGDLPNSNACSVNSSPASTLPSSPYPHSSAHPADAQAPSHASLCSQMTRTPSRSRSATTGA
ncbi:hypothetical protein OG21DRAFT_1035692 [Imleria badia]|nr:hypothetical protein OG21DRAFT_1035692 [Imleria badia]